MTLRSMSLVAGTGRWAGRRGRGEGEEERGTGGGQVNDINHTLLINPRRACAARVMVVVVCLFARTTSHFTSHESLHKQHHVFSVGCDSNIHTFRALLGRVE